MNGFLTWSSQGDPLARQASVAVGFSTGVPWGSVTSQSLMIALLDLSLAFLCTTALNARVACCSVSKKSLIKMICQSHAVGVGSGLWR